MVNEILSKYKLKRNFVGLYSRNSLYVEKNNLNDKNFHGYRDFDFEDFKLAINFLKKNTSNNYLNYRLSINVFGKINSKNYLL